MVISVAVLAVELRVWTDPASPPPEPLAGTLARTLRASQAIVDERVRSDTPTAIRDLATISVASYLYDRPTASGGGRFSNAWGNSGAEAMLSRWIDHKIAVIGGPDQAPYEAPDDAPAPIPEPSKSAKGPPVIDATLTSANPISPQARGDGRRAALQAVSDVRFAVDIEASFLEDGQPIEWTRILPITDETLTNDDRLTLNPLVAYRARLVSGTGPVRVLLG